MPKVIYTTPNGEQYEIEGTEAQIQAAVVELEAQSDPTFLEHAGDVALRAAHGANLVGRGAIEGAASLVTAPSSLIGKGLNAVTGTQFFEDDFGGKLSGVLDAVGAPTPQNEGEQALRFVGQAAGGGGAGGLAARAVAPLTSGVTQGVLRTVGQNPAMDAAGGVTGAAASLAAEQMGGGPITQTLAGMAGGMAAPVVASTSDVLRRSLSSFTEGGQQRMVGELLADQATLPQNAIGRLGADTPLPGTQATTGTQSRDPGLLALESSLRRQFPQEFTMLDSQNNTIRARALESISENPQDIARARDAATGPMREDALSISDNRVLNTDPILAQIDNIGTSPSGQRKAVQSAVKEYSERIAGASNARELYEIRKDLNLDLKGKSEGKRDLRFASKELIKIRNAMDAQIEEVAPGFRAYLDKYAEMSGQLDRAEILEEISKRSTSKQPDVVSGEDRLLPAGFKREVLKAEDAGLLTEDQLTVLWKIADDLDASNAVNAAGVRPSGSNTPADLTVAGIIGRAWGDSSLARTIARPMNFLLKANEQQSRQILLEAMMNPDLAKDLLKKGTELNVLRAASNLREAMGASIVGAELGQIATASPAE